MTAVGTPTHHYPPRHDTTWMLDAACVGHDPELWFPHAGQHGEAARAVCGTWPPKRNPTPCPVIHECLAYALAHDERYGIWGGKTEHERNGLRRQRTAPIITPACGTAQGAWGHYRRGERRCGDCQRANVEATRARRAKGATA